MDADVLNNLTDCKAIVDAEGNINPCPWWYETLGECTIPANVDCLQGIRKPQQDMVEFY